ncbi:MAG TPA: ribonuclease J [Acidimicrobiia bacterium]
MSLRVLFLGGLGEIGRNCAALEIDGRLMLIDCGLMFPEEDMLGVDLVFPDWSWVAERAADVEGVVITHGHEDHVGALAYFLAEVNVPVFGSELSLALARGRIDELGVEAELRPLKPKQWHQIGPFKFELIPVAHSVPDAMAVAFDTKAGIVLHTGDFKLDPTPIDGVETDLSEMAALGRRGVRLMLADSTNAERSGFVPSEASLSDPIGDIMRDAPGRVIAACFASHIHRIQQIVDAGLASGRSLAIFGRSMQRNTTVAQELKAIRIPSERVLDITDLLKLPPQRQLVLTTGSQGEPFAALSLMAAGRQKFVEVQKGDTILISAQPIPGNETAVSRVISQLLRRGATVYHGRNAPIHVSGHGAADELMTMLNVVKPRAFVPVHGEYRHLHAHAALARQVGVPWVEVCEDGDAVVLNGRKTSVDRRTVPAGYVYLDGTSWGDVKAVLRDRSHLADEGVVVVTVAVSRQSGELVYGPDLDSHGLMDDPEAVLGKAAEAVRGAVEETRNREGGAQAMQQAVREAASRVIRAETSRRPVIFPVVLEL